MFSASTLSEEQASLISEAYFKAGKDPRKMASYLGIEKFDMALLRHPLIKRKINLLAEKMRKLYTLEDHLDRLQQIRDEALDAGNLRIALAAELSVGKAAGLYEKVVETQVDSNSEDLQALSTDQIRQRLALMQGQPDAESVASEDLPGDEDF